MKTNINTIVKTISKHYNNVSLNKYYVEDENERYQKIVMCGHAGESYFWLSIIGNDNEETDIMKQVNMTDNRYEALYEFLNFI